MDAQRFSIKGRVFKADDALLQAILAQIHETPERPLKLPQPVFA